MNTSLLNKATSSDSSPTPGYLFEEISKMTLVSYDVNLKIIQWLALRLNNRSANVKWKVLLVCRHVAIKGSPQFKITMMREHLNPIKQHLQFSGPQDPLRGDEANQRVRDAAAHAIEALSSDTSSQVGASRMVGMGSDSQQSQQSQQQSNSYSSGGGGGGGGGGYANNSGKMQGIGSAPWDPNQKKVSMTSAAFSAARNVASKVVYNSGSSEQRNMSGNRDMSETYASNRGSNPHSNGSQWNPTPGFSSAGRVNNNHGNNGNYGNNNTSWSDGPRTNKGVGGVWGTQAANNQVASQPVTNSQNTQLGSSGLSGNTGGGDTDGTYERQLIVDLCAPGGTRAVPPQEELNRFIKLAPSLSPELVGPNLLEQFLSDGTWQAKNKALTVATSLVQADECVKHADWLGANAMDDLTVLAESSTKPQICTKAKALLALLNGEEAVVAAPVVRQHQTVTHVPSTVQSTSVVEEVPVEVDLLGGFSDSPPPQPAPQVATQVVAQEQAPPSPVQAPQPPSSAQPIGGSMFGNLTVKSEPVNVEPTPQAPPPQSQGSMFGGLSVKSKPTVAPPQEQVVPQVVPQVVSQVVPPPSIAVDDPFGFADLSGPSQPAPAQMGNSQQVGQQQQMGYMQSPQQMNPHQSQMQMNTQQMGYMQSPQQMNPHQSQMQMNTQGYMQSPQGYPMQNMNQQMNPQYQMNMQQPQQMNQMQYQQMQYQMNQMNMNQQQRVPMTQAMMSPVRSATASIPDMNVMQGSSPGGSKIPGSGFDFMGAGNRARGQSDHSQDDAFSFVKDSMKAK